MGIETGLEAIKIKARLVRSFTQNPEYGNPLGTRWFRESRFENYRIYYLIYEDLQAIYIVAISGKKVQQKTINTIRIFLDFFREEIERLVEGDNLQDEES